MIRPFTLLTAMLFALSGAYLFAVKHRAQVLDDEIAATAQATRLDQQRIRVAGGKSGKRSQHDILALAVFEFAAAEDAEAVAKKATSRRRVE